MDEMQALLDDLYLVCQPIMLCSHTNNSIDGCRILFRSRKLCAFPKNVLVVHWRKNAMPSWWLIIFRELKELIREPPQHQIVAESASKTAGILQRGDFWTAFPWWKMSPSNWLNTTVIPTEGADMLQTYISKLKTKDFSLAIDDIGSGQNNFELVTKNIQNIHTIKKFRCWISR